MNLMCYEMYGTGTYFTDTSTFPRVLYDPIKKEFEGVAFEAALK
jgi:hypothetical protein